MDGARSTTSELDITSRLSDGSVHRSQLCARYLGISNNRAESDNTLGLSALRAEIINVAVERFRGGGNVAFELDVNDVFWSCPVF